jgi:hypothetical protein
MVHALLMVVDVGQVEQVANELVVEPTKQVIAL